MNSAAYLIKCATGAPYGTAPGRFFANIGERLSTPAASAAEHLGERGVASGLRTAGRAHRFNHSVDGLEHKSREALQKLKDMGLDVFEPERIKLDKLKGVIPSPLRYEEHHHKTLRNLGGGATGAAALGLGGLGLGASKLLGGSKDE